MYFHPRFRSSFPGAGGPPLSRHLTPIRGCAAHMLELCGDGSSPWCRLVWVGAFPASFREGQGVDEGGGGSGCSLHRGSEARPWSDGGIAGPGDGRMGCNGGPSGISRCATKIDGIHPGMS